MSSHWRIYHNPRCSKSREALDLLKKSGVTPDVVEYLVTPINEDDLKDLLSLLRIPASDLVRKSEKVYSDLGLNKASDSKLVKAMVQNPILIERPIVVNGRRAVIGRPPENVLSLI